MSRMITTYGVDAALNRGSVVKTTWKIGSRGSSLEPSEEDSLEDYSELLSWNEGKGLSSSWEDLCRRANTVVKVVADSSIGDRSVGFLPRVGIDWDPSSGYWKNTNVRLGPMIAFMMGYMIKGFHSNVAIPVFLKPSDIRIGMQIKKKVTKVQLLHIFMNRLHIDLEGTLDFKDAMLLSYMVAIAEPQQT